MWKCTVLKLWGNLNPGGTGAVLPVRQHRAELVCAIHGGVVQDGLEVEGGRYCCREVPSLFFPSPSITRILEQLPFVRGSLDVTFSDPH